MSQTTAAANPRLATEVLARVAAPAAEEAFFGSLTSRSAPRLAAWACSYHYFSIQQARHLALVVRAVEPSDAETLSEVTRALFEEYGSGHPTQVHSVLFGRFARAVIGPGETLPIAREAVAPAILTYVDEIERAYRQPNIARAMGAYTYLERSAVLSYPMMVEALTPLGFSEDELRFFALHTIQEVHHDAAAGKMASRYVKDEAALEAFKAQIELMHGLWSAVWESFL